jgi:hypothetical protein
LDFHLNLIGVLRGVAASAKVVEMSVRMAVLDGDDEILVYVFAHAGEAAEMIAFLRGFLPKAEFVLEPLRH